VLILEADNNTDRARRFNFDRDLNHHIKSSAGSPTGFSVIPV
jgi:hypothetical protein